MALYLVKAGDNPLWVMHESADGDVYVYVQNTGKFHHNIALELDYFAGQELNYEPITFDTARDIIAAGRVGLLDPRIKAGQIQRYANDPSPLDASGILGSERDNVAGEQN